MRRSYLEKLPILKRGNRHYTNSVAYITAYYSYKGTYLICFELAKAWRQMLSTSHTQLLLKRALMRSGGRCTGQPNAHMVIAIDE